MRKNSRIHFDRLQTNTEIAEELNITPVWTKYMNRVESDCSVYTECIVTVYREY